MLRPLWLLLLLVAAPLLCALLAAACSPASTARSISGSSSKTPSPASSHPLWRRVASFAAVVASFSAAVPGAAAIAPVAGAAGRSFVFDGTSTAINVNLQCTNPIYLNRVCSPISGFSHLSIAVWVFPTAANSMTIIDRGGVVGQREYQMNLVLTTPSTPVMQIRLGNYSRGGGDWQQTFSVTLGGTSTAMLNTWSHLAFTYNGTSGQLSAYQNGALVTAMTSTGTNAFQLPAFLPTGFFLFSASSSTYMNSLFGLTATIGAMQNAATAGGALSSYFVGQMDQLHVYGMASFRRALCIE